MPLRTSRSIRASRVAAPLLAAALLAGACPARAACCIFEDPLLAIGDVAARSGTVRLALESEVGSSGGAMEAHAGMTMEESVRLATVRLTAAYSPLERLSLVATVPFARRAWRAEGADMPAERTTLTGVGDVDVGARLAHGRERRASRGRAPRGARAARDGRVGAVRRARVAAPARAVGRVDQRDGAGAERERGGVPLRPGAGRGRGRAARRWVPAVRRARRGRPRRRPGPRARRGGREHRRTRRLGGADRHVRRRPRDPAAGPGPGPRARAAPRGPARRRRRGRRRPLGRAVSTPWPPSISRRSPRPAQRGGLPRGRRRLRAPPRCAAASVAPRRPPAGATR